MSNSIASCVFCGIVAGDVSAFVVHQDDDVIAFLDKAPLFPGHVLVAPRAHVVTLPELPQSALGPYFSVVQRLADAVPRALGAQGTFVAMNNVVSQSVPHLHTHVVPRTKGDGLRGFFWPRRRYVSEADAARVAGLIRTELGNSSADDTLR